MIEFVLIYISLCFIICVITYLSEKFNSKKELNLICSLCIICVVLIPMIKSVPTLLDKNNLLRFEIEIESTDNEYISIQERISDNIETSVKDLIYETYNADVAVSSKIDFDDMTSIKIAEIKIITGENADGKAIYDLIKNTYFCEVKVYEKE